MRVFQDVGRTETAVRAPARTGRMGEAMTEASVERDRAWSRAEVEAALRKILVESLDVSEASVTPAASLVRELGAESIDFLDLGFEIQQTLGVDLQTAEIRSRIMAWTALIHPALVEILHQRYGATVTADALRAQESGGLVKILEHVRTGAGLAAGPEAADDVGRELLNRLVSEFSALGFTVSDVDRQGLLELMRADLSARRLRERTLDLLTVGALVDFICAKLGSRLRAA
jgi:acyl carrier protein